MSATDAAGPAAQVLRNGAWQRTHHEQGQDLDPGHLLPANRRHGGRGRTACAACLSQARPPGAVRSPRCASGHRMRAHRSRA